MIKKTRTFNLIKFLIWILPISLFSCSENYKHKVDLSGYEVEIKINRLEDDLFNVKTTDDYVNLNLLDSTLISITNSES